MCHLFYFSVQGLLLNSYQLQACREKKPSDKNFKEKKRLPKKSLLLFIYLFLLTPLGALPLLRELGSECTVLAWATAECWPYGRLAGRMLFFHAPPENEMPVPPPPTPPVLNQIELHLCEACLVHGIQRTYFCQFTLTGFHNLHIRLTPLVVFFLTSALSPFSISFPLCLQQK